VNAYRTRYGERFRAARLNADMTQTELADALDLSRSSVANIEAGRQGVYAEDVVRAAVVLGVDPGWLLGTR
jgi:transcriptional regulator with XRE-family HTH domain